MNRALEMLGDLFERVPERSAATHIAYPDGGNVRFALPVSVGEGGARFLSTKRGWATLALHRLIGRFKPGPAPWLAAAPRLREVAAFAGFDPDVSTVSAGTRRPYNKCTVLFTTDEGEPAAIAKIGQNEASRTMLHNEAWWLDRWERTGVLPGHRPSKMKFGETGSFLVLLQTVGLGPVLRLHAPLRQGHFEVLSAVQGSCAGPVPFLGSAMHAAMHRRFAACRDALEHDWRERLDRALGILEAGLAGADVPMVPAHRDFVPWNMRRTADGLFVFDWEYASDGCVPLYDLFHYVLMPRAMRRRLLVADARRAVRTVRAAAIRLPDGPAKTRHAALQLLAYLTDLCLVELEANEGRRTWQAGRFYGALIVRYNQWNDA